MIYNYRFEALKGKNGLFKKPNSFFLFVNFLLNQMKGESSLKKIKYNVQFFFLILIEA